jgi:hypothetical protein
MLLIILIFTGLALVSWWLGAIQLHNVRQQKRYFHLFAKQVDHIRARPDVPESVQKFVERLVLYALDRDFVNRVVWRALFGSAPTLSPRARQFLDEWDAMPREAREVADKMMVAFGMVASYSSLGGGPLLRRLMLKPLTRRGQAEFTVGSVFAYNQPAHA